MATDVEVLLSILTTLKEKEEASIRILNNYDLHLVLTKKKILKVFNLARNEIKYSHENSALYEIERSQEFFDHFYQKYKFMFETLLNNNKNMFVAIIRTWSKFWYYHMMTIFVSDDEPYNIGCSRSYSESIANEYKNLIDHCDFDVSNLALPEKCKLEIQEYREKRKLMILNDIDIMLSDSSTLTTMNIVAERMINNLPLTKKEIFKAFKTCRLNIIEFRHYKDLHYRIHKFFFETLLNKNKNMFVAVIKEFNNNKYAHSAVYYVSNNEPYKINNNRCTNNNNVIESYKTLLNHNDFDTTGLDLNAECELQIQEYRNQKYGGKLTKLANN